MIERHAVVRPGRAVHRFKLDAHGPQAAGDAAAEAQLAQRALAPRVHPTFVDDRHRVLRAGGDLSDPSFFAVVTGKGNAGEGVEGDAVALADLAAIVVADAVRVAVTRQRERVAVAARQRYDEDVRQTSGQTRHSHRNPSRVHARQATIRRGLLAVSSPDVVVVFFHGGEPSLRRFSHDAAQNDAARSPSVSLSRPAQLLRRRRAGRRRALLLRRSVCAAACRVAEPELEDAARRGPHDAVERAARRTGHHLRRQAGHDAHDALVAPPELTLARAAERQHLARPRHRHRVPLAARRRHHAARHRSRRLHAPLGPRLRRDP
mmetsp:Transcript_6306/g.19745  ORF Transcript_6306/g.19745 Transcript_6306/m.19745 type:complete len:320 (-) Transcript_6306:115-1074(-)